jgi:hypothetical protein
MAGRHADMGNFGVTLSPGGNFMQLLKLFVAAALVSGILLTVANAKPDYAKKENKKCVDCHEGGNPKKFTSMGQYYKDHNHSLEGYKAPEKK